jgi:superfamily II DNA or RNA helicase
MNISPQKPFQVVYALFQHQYLGYLFESFVVELTEQGELSLKHQNISSLNANEFAEGLDDTDFKLIHLMDSIQQDAIIRHFNSRKLHPAKFFETIFDATRKDTTLAQLIHDFLEKRRAKILALLPGKQVFEMGSDGDPTYKKLNVEAEKATVLFHFRRDEEGTNYFPTIKHKGVKLDFQGKNAMIICHEPAWLMVDQQLYTFEGGVDGNKLKPFLNKKFITVPKKMEQTYYQKFITPLVKSFDVTAKGFDIVQYQNTPEPLLVIRELPAVKNGTLFPTETPEADQEEGSLQEDRIVFTLEFKYGEFTFQADDKQQQIGVKLEQQGDQYTFYKVQRDPVFEEAIAKKIVERGIMLRSGRITEDKPRAFTLINQNMAFFAQEGIRLHQMVVSGKRYFIGKSSINLEIKEDRDWFDIHCEVRFGDFTVPFSKIRQLIVAGKKEFVLPNQEIAVIPDSWTSQYYDLFHHLEVNAGNHRLKKYHLSLVNELGENELAQVTVSSKLQKLKDFTAIEDVPLPAGFVGTLRPYQKAGYNWLTFLNEYNFGGCLADDMGLGKTVQTLALLQREKEKEPGHASLLIMPTSLLYNWEVEARKFTPELKVYLYTGTNRNKDITIFDQYDLVLTSYGVVRIDADLLEKYYFNYIILDESQVIKNPASIIARSVKGLKAKKRLVLTGTPIENTMLDLWSQMNFVNPGILGNQVYFKKEFQQPIERHNLACKIDKLQAVIKPFILRRHKSQVARDLPEKFETIQYATMTECQEKEYEEAKSSFRNEILDQIERSGVARSQMMLLQGLTLLRQLANHPRMVDPKSESRSGKLEDVVHMLTTTISENHKVLVFSQFVKHLSLLREELNQQGIDYAYLDGSTKNRQEEVERFQHNQSLKVFLISLKAGGLGLNLTAADYVFLLDPWWNPAVEAQAIDRAHRIGQTNTVFIYKFITRNTVEEKILALQKNKLEMANQLIKTEESFIKSLTREDIEQLLE